MKHFFTGGNGFEMFRATTRWPMFVKVSAFA